MIAPEVWADGLLFPEGPVLMPDGSIILSEITGGRIRRVWPDRRTEVVAQVPGMPNGLAFGPDGFLWCANMGGLLDPSFLAGMPGLDLAALQYRGGSIQRIDPATGESEDVITECDGRRLRAPDDLIFDTAGGFWFTDIGVTDRANRTANETGIYYGTCDGSVREVVSSMFPTNGIGLSPDGTRLYWTEYLSGRLFARDVVAPGELADPSSRYGDCLYIHPTPITWFDSLTIGAEGQVAVAVHDGTSTGKSGVITFSPGGVPLAFVAFDDPYTTHVIFSVEGDPTAYLTLSGTGRLVACPWQYHGIRPAFGPSAMPSTTPSPGG